MGLGKVIKVVSRTFGELRHVSRLHEAGVSRSILRLVEPVPPSKVRWLKVHHTELRLGAGFAESILNVSK